MSLGKYRAIDLTLFAIIVCIMQAVLVFARTKFNYLFAIFPAFALSVTILLLLIVMVRWQYWAIIHTILSGIVYAYLATKLDGKVFDNEVFKINALVYGIGNSFIIANVLLLKFIGQERLESGGWYLVLYATIGFVLVGLGRSLVGSFFAVPFVDGLTQFIQTESLNYLLAIIILFITNKQENMLVNQKEYFQAVRLGGKNEN